MKRWQCSVCGYVHVGDTPPDACPVCGAAKELFVALASEEPAGEEEKTRISTSAGPKADKWRCTICGYVHEGPEPPETCPVCGADRSLFEPLYPDPEETPPISEKKTPPDPGPTPEPPAQDTKTATHAAAGSGSTSGRFFEKLRRAIAIPPAAAERMHRHHAHPILVHLPNGLLPVAVLFTLIAAFFGCSALDTAAFCNQIMVLLAMPLVALTGYSDWQYRFGGHLTQVFKVKLGCAAAITALLFILIVWRMMNPHILSPDATGRWLYLFFELAALVFASVAGFYGGKLVFRD